MRVQRGRACVSVCALEKEKKGEDMWEHVSECAWASKREETRKETRIVRKNKWESRCENEIILIEMKSKRSLGDLVILYRKLTNDSYSDVHTLYLGEPGKLLDPHESLFRRSTDQSVNQLFDWSIDRREFALINQTSWLDSLL